MKKNGFSIASFNLCNLNEPGLAMYGAAGLTQAEYDRKIAWTAEQIGAIDADVVGFQELWHEQSLRSFMKASGREADYDLIVPQETRGREIVCAAIARKGFLVGRPEWISEFPAKLKLSSKGEDPQTPEIAVSIRGFSRPILHFAIQPNDDQLPIQVYVCHFKSKMGTEISKEPWYAEDASYYKKHSTCIGYSLSTIRRTAEAAALRMLLTEAMKGTPTPVIVVGDMNDNTYSNTTNLVSEQPTYLVGDAEGGGDNALYSAQTLQEYRDTRDVYYTYVHEGLRESLDQIFFSQELYDHSRKRIWLFTGMIVNNDHLNYPDHKARGTSDHGVIRAGFKLKPQG